MHIVAEVLDVVAPYISSWVIVDTGSDDGTQDLIRNHMARLGIPGELHERPWRNFGHNRTEALTLAQGHADYILIMDADDTFVGTPDFTRLDADIYLMRYFGHGDVFWVPQLFRDGVHVRWKGVTHEYAVWDDSCVVVRLDGDYNIGDRHLSTRNLSGEKYVRDRDLLLAELERNPEDTRSAFYLAQSYFCLGDLVNARKWYARRIEMGGWAEEVGYSMYKLALSMEQSGEPWPDVQDAYLRAWEFRPARAEGLHAIARRYRADQRYRLGYLFAKKRRRNPIPRTGDTVCPPGHLYLAHSRRAGGVRILDRQACRGVHTVAAPAGPTRPARRGSAEDRAQPRRVCADDDRRGVSYPDTSPAAVPATPGRTRPRGGRQPHRRAGSRQHRAHAELVSALLHRCLAGRALPGDRRRTISPGPRTAARPLRIPRVCPT